MFGGLASTAAMLTTVFLAAAQAGAVHGRVIDARTLAPLTDVRVVLTPLDEAGRPIDGLARAAATGADGRFEFPAVAHGSYSLSISTVGYIFVRRRVDVTSGLEDLVLPLAEGAGTYEEHVTVTASGDEATKALTERSLGPAALQDLRGVVTDDPMRAVHALPGVATGDDFQAGFSVRGSPFRHAGVTIDGVPAMRLLHAVNAEANTGSVSMINTDVLARATLAVGARPAPDGDWIGATLAFDLREGSRDRTTMRAALSGTSASVVAEGPLASGRRGSWLVSLRKSYLDWLVRVIEPGFDSTVGFWDGHVKVAFDVTPRHEIQAFVVGGDARYRDEAVSSPNSLMRARSGSTLSSLQWRYAGSRWVQRQRLFFLGSEFQQTGSHRQVLVRGYTQEAGWRGDAEAALPAGWLVSGGGAWSALRGAQSLRNFERAPGGDVAIRATEESVPAVRAGSLWMEARRSADRGRVSLGVRGTGRSDTPDRVWLPWVIVERDIGRVTVRAAGGGSAQFADIATLFADGEDARVERAVSFDTGMSQRVGALEWSVVAFARRERDVLRPVGEDRLDAATGERVAGALFPEATLRLDGRAAGVDVIVRRQAATGVNGWVSYTWARSRMRDPATGERFDADFDQRHTFNLVASQRLSYRSAMGVKFRVGSNMPLVGYFEPDGDGLRLSSARNRVRLPVYARLDLRATRAFTFVRHRLTLFIEVMNVLGRRNVGPADPSVRASLQVTGYAERLIPRVPSAGFVVEF